MSTASITLRTRQLLSDTGMPFAASLPVNGTATVFDLPVESISETASPPLVYFNGTLISNQATPAYTFDYTHGVISFLTAPEPAGAILGVQGITYDYFTDDLVTQAVTDSFNLHVDDQSPLPVIDPISGQTGVQPVEEYPIAQLAAIECLWIRSTDASQMIDIHTPEGVFIPRAQRYQQIIDQISKLKAEYNQLTGALGVGLYRIQVLWQRRVSYTTNRLIPLYEEQEYNAPYTSFNPTAAPVGALIAITGMYFTGATDVQFGGVSCQGEFTIINDSQLTATVPVGAVTGQIAVVTPYGMVLSTAQFVVGQPPPFLLYGPEQVLPPIPPGI